MSENTMQATSPKATTIRDMLVLHKDQIKAALPAHMTPDRMARIAMTAIRQTPKLLSCDATSLFGAIITASQLGLEPGIQGQCYIIPYGREAQLIPGYRGLIDLAIRSGKVRSIEAHAVRAGDVFICEFGLDPKLSHRVDYASRGELVAVYAIATLADGHRQIEVMSKADVDKIRSRSKSAGSGPWVTDYEEMARKTVTKRLCKYLPSSVELRDALALDDAADAGQPQGNAATIIADYEIGPEPEQVENDGAEAPASQTERAKAAMGGGLK
jgi:recombination protein RecT